MADAENVTKLEPKLPDSITISGTPDVRMTPNEIRKLKAETGKTLTDLMGEDADDADRLQGVIWLQLTREGFDLTWEQAGNVSVRYGSEVEQPDPSKAAN